MEINFQSLVQFLILKRHLLLVTLIVLTISGIPYLNRGLKPNNNISIWFAENDPTLIAYKKFNSRYGNDRVIMILFESKEGILTKNSLHQLGLLTKNLISIEGVKECWSIFNIPDFRRETDGKKTTIKYASYFENEDQTEVRITAQTRDAILNNDYLVGRFINQEGTLAPIVIQLESNEYIDQNRAEVIRQVMNHSEKILGNEGVYYGGIEISYYSLNQLSRHDFILFMGINFSLAFLMIFLVYRNWYYVILAVGSTFTATLLTFSIYGFFDYRCLLHLFQKQ